VSGVVEAIGPGVTIFAPGDEVFGMPRFPHPAGAYAEFVTSPARHVARKPTSVDHVSAAAIPWQALVDTATAAKAHELGETNRTTGKSSCPSSPEAAESPPTDGV